MTKKMTIQKHLASKNSLIIVNASQLDKIATLMEGLSDNNTLIDRILDGNITSNEVIKAIEKHDALLNKVLWQIQSLQD